MSFSPRLSFSDCIVNLRGAIWQVLGEGHSSVFSLMFDSWHFFRRRKKSGKMLGGRCRFFFPETSQTLVSQMSWEDSQETISDTFVGLGMEILHGGKHERKKILTRRM